MDGYCQGFQPLSRRTHGFPIKALFVGITSLEGMVYGSFLSWSCHLNFTPDIENQETAFHSLFLLTFYAWLTNGPETAILFGAIVHGGSRTVTSRQTGMCVYASESLCLIDHVFRPIANDEECDI